VEPGAWTRASASCICSVGRPVEDAGQPAPRRRKPNEHLSAKAAGSMNVPKLEPCLVHRGPLLRFL